MRPMRPSGSRRAVPIALPDASSATAWSLASSHSSHSSSRGTACSSMNTRSRTGRASGRASRQVMIRIVNGVGMAPYNPTDAELVEGRGGEAVQGRPGAARLYLAAARPRQVPGAARRGQHLGQDQGEEPLRRGGDHPLRQGLRLAELPSLSDPEMVNQLVTHMLRASAPAPSIETILHGLMPQKFVDHTHADAVLSVTNTKDGEKRIREIYGKRCVVIPYLIPGFDLAQFCAKAFRAQGTPDTIGMVLLNHGIFSFGETARESYERMIELVTLAEKYLESKRAWSVAPNYFDAGTVDVNAQASLRRKLSDTAATPLILRTVTNERTLGFAQHPQATTITQRGPATPDHVIRTKRTPLLGTDVGGYVADYKRYFGEHASKAKEPKNMLDPAPRVVLDPGFGLAAAGRTAKDAAIVDEIYDHTMDVILRAEALGGFQALPAKDIFDVEDVFRGQ